MQNEYSQPLLEPPAAASPKNGNKGAASSSDAAGTVFTSAFFSALINSIKSVFGTGLLALPFAFVQLGRDQMATACVVCAVIGAWSAYTMLLIYKCAVLAWPIHHPPGYATLVQAALGGTGSMLCSINLVIHQVMVVATYLVFIGDALQDVLGGQMSFYAAGCAVPLALLCWLPDVRAIGPASAIGTCALAITLCLVLHEGCAGPHDDAAAAAGAAASSGRRLLDPTAFDPKAASNAPPSEAPPASFVGALAQFVGISIFSFAGHDSVVPVMLSFGKAHPRDAPYTWLIFCLGGVAIPGVLAFASTASACFGALATKNILLAIHTQVASALKLLMAAAIFFTCPIKMFPAFDICEASLGLTAGTSSSGSGGGRESSGVGGGGGVLPSSVAEMDSSPPPPLLDAAAESRLSLLRKAERTTLVFLAVFLALACPDFEFLVAFIGAFCMGLIAFVLPPLMYCSLLSASGACSGRGSSPGRLLAFLLHLALALLGFGVFAGSTYSVVRNKLLAAAAS